MTTTQIAGAVILAAVFGGMFYATAKGGGWLEATKIWLGSFALSALVMFAAYLLLGAP